MALPRSSLAELCVCLGCSSKDVEIINATQGWVIIRCMKCGSEHWHEDKKVRPI